MSPSAHLTILWGATPIGSATIRRGQSVGIGDGGVITRASGHAPPALVVRMQARGASVSRPAGAARGAAERHWIPTGADVHIAIAAPGALPVYRRRMAWEPAPVTLRIAVTAENPGSLRRPLIPARLWGAVASVAAAHAVALVIAGAEMPPLTPFLDEAFASESASPSSFRVDAIPDEGYRDAPGEDRFGSAPVLCSGARPIGHSLAVRGPSDNLDPHIARYHEPEHAYALSMIGLPVPPNPSDEDAPIAPWGRDDVLGADPFSAMGTASGAVKHAILATCFGPPPETWSCAGRDDPPEPATPERLGLIGIGEASARAPEPSSESWMRRRPERVVMGPIAVDANVPRWVVASAVRDDVVDDARACYERALADDATLAGRLDVVVKVRGEDVSVKLEPSGDLARSSALLCCVDHAHEFLTYRLPAGTRATGRYSITFGWPDPPPG